MRVRFFLQVVCSECGMRGTFDEPPPPGSNFFVCPRCGTEHEVCLTCIAAQKGEIRVVGERHVHREGY